MATDCSVFPWLQARLKGEKRRQKVEEQVMKAAHSQRQEAAQLRREEKIRADKERLMNEEDPDKARKLEVSHSVLPWLQLQCVAMVTG